MIFGRRPSFQTLRFGDGSRYEGLTLEGKPSGQGSILFEDGARATGIFLEGRLHGQAEMQWPDGTRYRGMFRAGLRHGTGTYEWPNGNSYVGETVRGVRTGKGKFTSAHGWTYDGDFVDGEFHGEGVMMWPDGTRYQGGFRNDQRHGTGTYEWPNGNCYFGHSMCEARTGKGRFTSADGWTYEGDFVDGERHGRGVMLWPDGTRYEGEFRQGQRHGKGRYVFADGGYYEGDHVEGDFEGEGYRLYSEASSLLDYRGQWNADNPHGEGVMRWKSGARNKGHFVDGQVHGRGAMLWPDGTRYEGEYRQGQRHGKGRYVFADGGYYEGDHVEGDFEGEGYRLYSEASSLLDYRGQWKANEPYGEGVMRWKDGDRYEGNFVDGARHGKGRYHFSDGSMADGFWFEGARDGLHTDTSEKGIQVTRVYSDGNLLDELSKAYPQYFEEEPPFDGDFSALRERFEASPFDISATSFSELAARCRAEAEVRRAIISQSLRVLGSFGPEEGAEPERLALLIVALLSEPTAHTREAEYLMLEMMKGWPSADFTVAWDIFTESDYPSLRMPLAASFWEAGSRMHTHLEESISAPLYRKNFIHAVFLLNRYYKGILDKNSSTNAREFLEVHHPDKADSYGSVTERLSLMHGFYGAEDPEAALLMAEPFEDLWNFRFIHMLAMIFGNPNNALYNPVIAGAFHHIVALLEAEESSSCSMSAFQLGFHFAEGREGRVDRASAAFWFEAAGMMGHGMGYQQAYALRHAIAAEGADPVGAAESAELDWLIEAAEASGQPCVMDMVNMRYAFGAGRWNDQERVERHYREVSEGDFWGKPQTDALLGYALRNILLRDDRARARQLLEKLLRETRDSDSPSYYFDANYYYAIKKLKSVFGRLGTSLDGGEISLSNSYSRDFEQVVSILRESYLRPAEAGDIAAKLIEMFDEDGANGDAIFDALSVGKMLAEHERWHCLPVIARAFRSLNAHRLGLSPDKLKRSALILGPTYNPLDGATSLPILGEHLAPSISESEASRQFEETGRFVPTAGIVAINAVRGTTEGNIDFSWLTSETRPALILPEDLDVALVLAFGEAEGPVWPSLSLERDVKGILEDDNAMFSAKIWVPDWLEHTHLGRTLYAADELIGCLAWFPENFRIAEPASAFDPSFPGYVRQWVDDLRFMGGAGMVAYSRLINISPESMPCSVSVDAEAGEVVAHIANMKVRINGAYVRKTDDHEDRRLGWNDARLQQGRLTQYLTDRYGDICLMMPMFSRLRELMGLLYGLADLRDSGFWPNENLHNQIDEIHRGYRALGSGMRESLVVESFPFQHP